MGYGPNIDAVVFFAREVWPRVLAVVPNARFVIAGRGPTQAVVELGARPGIEVHPDVPDMRRTIAAAWIGVAPMTSGSGIKNKVLEAWAVGKPVVMTSLGANGLRLDDAARGLVTDDPAVMATLVAGLLHNASERHRLGAAALALARYKHGWGDAAQQVNRLLEDAIRAGPG
jgi:glycosyltransferase involved in cell wall biosynthesis